MKKTLAGKRVAVLAVDGFEQVEATIPMAALRRAGADVRLISLRPGNIRGMNYLVRGRKLPVDDTVGNVQVEDYSALLIPGGFVNPDLLRQSEQVKQLVRDFDAAGLPIATICHGPWVLISAQLARGRRLTSWPGIADDVRNAGAEWVDDKVVRDRNWISSRSPLDLPAFVPAMLELFAAQAPAAETKLPRPRARFAATLSRAVSWSAVPLLLAAVSAGGKRAASRASGRPGWLLPLALGVVGVTVAGRLSNRPRLKAAVKKGYDLALGASPANGAAKKADQTAPEAQPAV